MLPGYATFGTAAPILPIALQLLQGLALGGEYGRAARYVAEHAPHGRRGLYTRSFIQPTAPLGPFLSLPVILQCRLAFGPADFEAWGWRVPFVLSAVPLALLGATAAIAAMVGFQFPPETKDVDITQ
jgi:MFS family permease